MAKEKTRNDGQWTESRFRSFITSLLRSGTRRWPPKYTVLKESYTKTKKNLRTGRQAKHYRCAICSNDFPATAIQIDHKIPIGSCNSWDLFIERLFCEKENLQTVCKPCHKIKTKKENN